MFIYETEALEEDKVGNLNSDDDKERSDRVSNNDSNPSLDSSPKINHFNNKNHNKINERKFKRTSFSLKKTENVFKNENPKLVAEV